MKVYKSGSLLFGDCRCSSDNDCPLDKVALNRISRWRNKIDRNSFELHTIIEEELENSIERRRKFILGITWINFKN